MDPQALMDGATQGDALVGLACAAAGVASVFAMQYARSRRAPPAPKISSRGNRLLKPALPYVEVLLKAFANKYSAENPDGCVPMLVAENNISFDILRPELLSFSDFSPDIANYANASGIDSLKAAIANIMSQYVTKHPVPTNQLVISAGLTAVLNMLFYCICEEGDAVLIPTPYYSAFDFDVSAIARTVPIEVRTASHNAYEITDEVLDDAAKRAIAAGHTPKALLLTNPNNPLGVTYSADELRRMIAWSKRNGMHLVSDEIYALSTYDESKPFTSVAEVLNNELGTHVHILWALSKDFCMSGGRCGALYTQNKQALQAVESLCMISQLPTSHQEALAHLLSNEELVAHFISENKRRLAAAAARVRTGLARLGIPILPSNAGLFVWADFRRALSAPTFEAEMELFYELFEAGVALTPGSSQHAQQPGFFRVCFAWPSNEALGVAIDRIEKFLVRKGLL